MKVRDCPGCGENVRINVSEARRSKDSSVRRAVNCGACGARWRTREVVEKVIHDPNREMRAFDWSI